MSARKSELLKQIEKLQAKYVRAKKSHKADYKSLEQKFHKFHKADLESKLDDQRIFLTQKKRYELQNLKMRLEAAYENKIEELKDQMKQAHEDQKSAENQLESLHNKMSQCNLELENEIEDLKLEIIEIKSSHEKELAREAATFYDADIESRRKMADLRCAAANLKFEVSDLEAELKDQKIKISSLEIELQHQKVKNSKLGTQLEVEKVKNADLQTELRDQKVKDSALETELKDQEIKISDLDSKLKDQASKNSDLGNQLKPRDDEDEDNKTDSDADETTESNCEKSSDVEDQEDQDQSELQAVITYLVDQVSSSYEASVTPLPTDPEVEKSQNAPKLVEATNDVSISSKGPAPTASTQSADTSTLKCEPKLGEVATRKRKIKEDDTADHRQEGPSEAKIPRIQDFL